jgi:hypothetical protein
MTKPAQVRVTVARGCHVTVPHSSGIAELRRTLSGGETFETDPATAAELFAARLVNDPQTGAPPPPPPAKSSRQLGGLNAVKAPPPPASRGPMISVGGGPFVPMEGHVVHQGDWAATAEEPVSRDRAPKPPPHNCLGPTLEELRERNQEW